MTRHYFYAVLYSLEVQFTNSKYNQKDAAAQSLLLKGDATSCSNNRFGDELTFPPRDRKGEGKHGQAWSRSEAQNSS
jgi:hypothetical protein